MNRRRKTLISRRGRTGKANRLGALCPLLALWLGFPTMSAPEDLLVTHSEPGRAGGRLVVALRNEPRTFNPVVAGDLPSLTVIRRLMSDLIHVDRQTQRTVPSLAKSWTRSPDGRSFVVELRRGIRFSDGHPLDAGDVVFTFKATLDPASASPYRGQLLFGDEPIAVRALGPYTLSFELAEPDAWGVRLFNDLSILPEHKLTQAVAEGRLAEAWGPQTPPGDIVGLGPFRLTRYLPGERLELERNPHYWKVDRAGRRLPYLDRLVFLIVASEDAQTLRFQAGETHMIDRMSAASFAVLERAQSASRTTMSDLGPGLGYEFLFFNLNDLDGRGLESIESKQRWFETQAFRQAVSLAIDRDSIVRLVYRGRATAIASHVSPGNKLWANSALRPPERSVETARKLLTKAGFSWDERNRLHDSLGEEVTFQIAASASNSDRQRMAAIIQDDLAQLGIRVQVAPIEFRSLVDRVLRTFNYEACLFGLGAGDGDPNSGMAVWLSSGEHHFWHPRQAQPTTAWEAEIDRLMRQQRTTLDPDLRKQLNHRIQALVSEQSPFIFLVSPNILVGARQDLGNFSPAVLEHSTLWNVEELFWRRNAGVR